MKGSPLLEATWEKYKVWALTHIVFLGMLFFLILRPSAWKALTSYSGFAATGFLILVLMLSPLKTLFPSFTPFIYLNRYRREIGVACFSYAFIHLLCFILKRGGMAETIPYLFHPALIPAFWIAFPVFFLLTLTSNQFSIRKLGFLK